MAHQARRDDRMKKEEKTEMKQGRDVIKHILKVSLTPEKTLADVPREPNVHIFVSFHLLSEFILRTSRTHTHTHTCKQ